MRRRRRAAIARRISPIEEQTMSATAEKRLDKYDWQSAAGDLDNFGCAVLEKLLTPEECSTIASLYDCEEHFRTHIVMARHGFGKGEYRYFAYPLPDPIGGLRTALYPNLAPIANEWNERMGVAMRYPSTHSELLKLCHD